MVLHRGCRQQTGETLGVLLKAADAASKKLEYGGHAEAAVLRDKLSAELTQSLARVRAGARGSSEDRCVSELWHAPGTIAHGVCKIGPWT